MKQLIEMLMSEFHYDSLIALMLTDFATSQFLFTTLSKEDQVIRESQSVSEIDLISKLDLKDPTA